MNKKKIKLGVVCFVRHTFDFDAAAKVYEKILCDLKNFSDVDFTIIEKTVFLSEEAVAAGEVFASKNVDAIVAISGTFHLGHLILEIKKICDKPILLWALPELPYDGGKIRLNSVCGLNDFCYHVGDKIDEDFVDAVRMSVALRDARIGLIGSRAHGFFNCGVDELSLYGKFKTLIDYYTIDDLIKTEGEGDYIKKIKENFDFSAVSKEQLEKISSLAAKMKKFIDEKGLAAIAIRCWPEFADSFGIVPCASMSVLQSEDYLLACEGDIDCLISMICHRAVGAKAPFSADLSQVNIDEDSALLWHCGVASCDLKDANCNATLDTYHAQGRGVTAGFVMKEGEVSFARLDSVGGKYRLFHEVGKTLPMEKSLRGTFAKVRFSRPVKEVLDKAIYTGVAHHVSMVYGDYSKIFKIFARLKNIEVL
jgi:L-fucose isomerase-like protein